MKITLDQATLIDNTWFVFDGCEQIGMVEDVNGTWFAYAGNNIDGKKFGPLSSKEKAITTLQEFANKEFKPLIEKVA